MHMFPLFLYAVLFLHMYLNFLLTGFSNGEIDGRSKIYKDIFYCSLVSIVWNDWKRIQGFLEISPLRITSIHYD